MADQGDQSGTTWWTLGQIVDWVRRVDPIASVGDIRIALERRCGSGRIRARGRRQHYAFDAVLPIGSHDPNFIWFSDQHGRLETGFGEISAGEWRDLTFFARPTAEVGEQYRTALARAFERIDSPVELRSISKYRLAWCNVEFCRDDVVREWVHPDNDGDRPDDPTKPPLLVGVPVVPAPVSNRDLRRWYEQRIEALAAQDQVSSGEEDWAAAKEQFPNRVTRARVRMIREECAPVAWRKQGRRAPNPER